MRKGQPYYVCSLNYILGLAGSRILSSWITDFCCLYAELKESGGNGRLPIRHECPSVHISFPPSYLVSVPVTEDNTSPLAL